MSWSPGLVIAVDWSASSTIGPERPSPDRCWIAHSIGDREPTPEYFRTRAACEHRVNELITSNPGPTLIGFDVAIGYPALDDGSHALPTGRTLAALIRSLIEDNGDGTNNRFGVAAELNRRVRARTGRPEGPFWGRPASFDAQELSPTKPRDTGVPEYRRIERTLRDQGHRVLSPFQLMGTGAVGSQSLLALPVIDRILERADPRGVLWPFETPQRENSIVIAEIWPSLCDTSGINHPIKDARQVIAACGAIRACGLEPLPDHNNEGSILNATERLTTPRVP